MKSKRARIRLASYASALVLCMAGVLASSFTGAGNYETRINADTARALGNTLDAVQSLDSSLKKCAFAVTPVMENRLCMEIFGDARQVEIALASLPVRSDSLEKIAKHVAVVGDYAAGLSNGVISGSLFDDAAIRQLSQFSERTEQLHDDLAALRERVLTGDVKSESFARITDSLDNLESELAEDVQTLSTEMQAVSESFPEADPVAYDGLYSEPDPAEHDWTQGKTAISREQAREIAGDWLSVDPSALQDSGSRSGMIACYCFTAKDASSETEIAVSRYGGAVFSATEEKEVTDSKLTKDEAEDCAERYLAKHGLDDLECFQTTISGGNAVFQFVPVEDGSVLCLPDLVRVMVSLDDGSVTGYDAAAYHLHHKERDLSAFQDLQTNPEAAVPASLHIRSVRPVVLQPYGGDEQCCYCLDCESQAGDPYRIYVDAVSGEQRQILLPEELEPID